MKVEFKEVILRDYCESDIADEIRWFTSETAWMVADTPWEPIIPADENELKNEMLQFILEMPSDGIRSRLEIETEGQHIGFVSAYLLDNEVELPHNKTVDEKRKHCALGIEICEPTFWGRGLGSQALTATILYYQENGFTDFYLETWSGNARMLKCAERLGFYICNQITGTRKVNGKNYDALTLHLDNERFKT